MCCPLHYIDIEHTFKHCYTNCYYITKVVLKAFICDKYLLFIIQNFYIGIMYRHLTILSC